MDGAHPVVFGIRPDDVRVYDSNNYNDGSWAPAKAVVSVVEVLGGETLIYANLNLGTPDATDGAIIIKAGPDVSVRRGDIIDIEISLRKFHLFDKETEKSIRKRIPEENIISATIHSGSLVFKGQHFPLPSAISCQDCDNAEIAMPIEALTIGAGCGNAKVQWKEQIEDKTLYFLTVDDLTLFSLGDKNTSFNIGDEVKFDIDFTKISSEKLGIEPLRLTNTLDGIFTKEKNKATKLYDFYMNVGKQRLVPNDSICEKLFACKGNKIFHTPLEYVIDANELAVHPIGKSVYNALRGTVLKILDYGQTKYAVIDTCAQQLIAKYDGKPGDEVEVFVPVDKLTIKDKTIDITIV
jgi:hypothetical protein